MTRLRTRAFPTIVFGGLAVGVLDGLAATIHAAILGVSPTRVWQYVASSLLGSEAFNGGARTLAIGLLFHFGVAFGVAIGFWILARLFPILLEYAVASGILYGIVVYFGMSYAVVPQTTARQMPFSWYGLISGLIIHILFVGLPVALIAKRFAR